MTTATKRTATYNGNTYTLLYLGNTRYGRRAHLEYRDGSKDFWVNADRVTETTEDPDAGYGPRCGMKASGARPCLCDDPTNNWCPRCDG